MNKQKYPFGPYGTQRRIIGKLINGMEYAATIIDGARWTEEDPYKFQIDVVVKKDMCLGYSTEESEWGRKVTPPEIQKLIEDQLS